MFTITIKDLTFLTIVGILDKERTTLQEVVVDASIRYDKSDKTFINYAEVAELIEESMKEKKYFLLEEALEDISMKIKRRFKSAKEIRLKIYKPNILDNCVVGVEIFKNY